MTSSPKLIYGVGINDADYPIYATETVGGRRRTLKVCPAYRVWTGMIERCYSVRFQARNPTYHGCSVANEWLTFSVFRAWMLTQEYEGNHLDKDILVPGNKVYSADTCAFVSPGLNNFVLDSHTARRGELPIGVSWKKGRNRYVAQCRNPFTGRHDHIGHFLSPAEAHEAWRKHKHHIAQTYAEQQKDQRIAEALRARYAA